MLVEVRVLLKGSLPWLFKIIEKGLGKAFPLFRGVVREDMAVHYAGVLRVKEKNTAWLCYRVFRDGEMTRHDGMRRAPTRILWVK